MYLKIKNDIYKRVRNHMLIILIGLYRYRSLCGRESRNRKVKLRMTPEIKKTIV